MRSFLLILWMAWSSRWYSPVQALSCIPNKCSSVDLPAPEGPMMETNSPSLISALMRRRTKVLVGPCSKYFSTFRRTTIGELIDTLILLRFGHSPPLFFDLTWPTHSCVMPHTLAITDNLN